MTEADYYRQQEEADRQEQDYISELAQAYAEGKTYSCNECSLSMEAREVMDHEVGVHSGAN